MTVVRISSRGGMYPKETLEFAADTYRVEAGVVRIFNQRGQEIASVLLGDGDYVERIERMAATK